jgi:hypothetical protein
MKYLIIVLLFLSCTNQGSRKTARSSTLSSTSFSVTGFHIRHFVDPETGNYSEKLTIPKNYDGRIFLAVDELENFQDRRLFVRLRFGHFRDQEKIIKTTVAEAPSLIPGQMQKVLAFNLSKRDFVNVSLDYDLFDYNQYNSSLKNVTDKNRDTGLYCRGLRGSDDPTGNCSAGDSQCLYSYAKIEDQGLFLSSSQSSSSPSLVQQMLNPEYGENYWEDLSVDPSTFGPNLTALNSGRRDFYLKRCLSDSDIQAYPENNLPFGGLNFSSFTFKGPYRFLNESSWEIKGTSNIYHPSKGIFRFRGFSQVGTSNVSFGYESFMFPLYSKRILSSGVEYIGHKTLNPLSDPDVLSSLDSDGKTFWMSGCNTRIDKDSSNHHIGSCNVSSVIEVFYYDEGKEVLLASSGWGESSKKVKLQLVRNGSLSDRYGSSGQSCSSDLNCGESSCCFNGSCWSRELVTQCSGGRPFGGKTPGERCDSDFDCASLCCKKEGSGSSSVCGGAESGNNFQCKKKTGESCISSQSCGRSIVKQKIAVWRPYGANRADGCDFKTYATLVYNDCSTGSYTCEDVAPLSAVSLGSFSLGANNDLDQIFQSEDFREDLRLALCEGDSCLGLDSDQVQRGNLLRQYRISGGADVRTELKAKLPICPQELIDVGEDESELNCNDVGAIARPHPSIWFEVPDQDQTCSRP